MHGQFTWTWERNTEDGGRDGSGRLAATHRVNGYVDDSLKKLMISSSDYSQSLSTVRGGGGGIRCLTFRE